ncbi:MAG: FAD-dependent oxidoreductase [Cyclobacteriaceae bacterium]|nr:FAD-dependent oxidoreductase [Cyclobacteriaceae bacterium]
MSTNTFAPVYNKNEGKAIEPLKKGSRVVVIGAGAFGGWTALYLLRAGFEVTLLDAWGPGNSRSSSGDETRVIRSTYGGNQFYFNLNVRALQLWKENEQQWKTKLFQNKGVLWFCYDEHTPLVEDSVPFAKAHGMEYEKLSTDELNKRYPILNTGDLHHAYLDQYGGCLRAREACQAVFRAFLNEGGQYLQSVVQPGKILNGRLEYILLANGNTLKANRFIFACGSWLGYLFPEILSNIITCSKQEVYYFGVPETQADQFDKFPVWVDVDGKNFYYGIPGNNYRGFKIGVDERGEPFHPSTGDRIYNTTVLEKARKFIAHRFPDLAKAPLVENRVCPYENSPDGNFLFDQHPEVDNILFLGGGSGHGFKHGPALGEMVSLIIEGKLKIPPFFLINRV